MTAPLTRAEFHVVLVITIATWQMPVCSSKKDLLQKAWIVVLRLRYRFHRSASCWLFVDPTHLITSNLPHYCLIDSFLCISCPTSVWPSSHNTILLIIILAHPQSIWGRAALDIEGAPYRVRQQETQWRSVWKRSDLHNSLAAITSRCSTVTSLHLCFHSCETADTFCFHSSAVLFPQFHTGYFHSCKTGDACYFIPNLAPASHSVKQDPPTFTNKTNKQYPMQCGGPHF